MLLELLPIEAQLKIVNQGKILFVKDMELLTDYLEELLKRAIETMVNRLILKKQEDELYTQI